MSDMPDIYKLVKLILLLLAIKTFPFFALFAFTVLLFVILPTLCLYFMFDYLFGNNLPKNFYYRPAFVGFALSLSCLISVHCMRDFITYTVQHTIDKDYTGIQKPTQKPVSKITTIKPDHYKFSFTNDETGQVFYHTN